MASQRTRSRFHQPFSWKIFVLGLFVSVLLMAVLILHPTTLLFLELKLSDLRMNARKPRPLSGQVAVVAIDDESIAKLGHWPWPRNVLAHLENALASYNAKVVGYDLIFSEADSDVTAREEIATRLRAMKLGEDQIHATLGQNNDEKFARAMTAQRDTVLAYGFARHTLGDEKIADEPGYLTVPIQPLPMAYTMVRRAAGPSPVIFHADAYLPPTPVLNSAAKGTAFVDIEGDADGEYRTELGVIRFDGRYCVPFFLAVARAYEDNPPLTLNIAPYGIASLSLGDTNIPVDEIGRMMVSFRGPAATFPHYSAVDVIEHRVPAEKLAGKIVLVGATAKAIGDRATTPAGPEFPRVEIHANAIDDVLTRDFVDRSLVHTVVVERASAILLAIGISLAVAWLTAIWSAVAVLAMSAVYVWYAQHTLVVDNILLGVALPLAVSLGTYLVVGTYRFAVEGIEKRHLRHAFEHYLHPDIIASVVDDPAGLKLGGARRHLAILFSDIVGFTSRAEKSDPEQLVALLNDYMTQMTDIILESGGVVDKLMGDGIMAFWGAPNAVENPSRSAIDCALRMLEKLREMRKNDPRFADLDVGIGIATGEAIAGNFGGERHFAYSLIGDTVNFASRLEGLTRKFKVHLLVSKATYTEAGDGYIARDIGLVKVKGKQELVPIVEIAAHANDGADPAFYQQFATALSLLRSGEVVPARRQLELMLADHPDDEVVGLYLEKLDEAAESAPREMIFEFETK